MPRRNTYSSGAPQSRFPAAQEGEDWRGTCELGGGTRIYRRIEVPVALVFSRYSWERGSGRSDMLLPGSLAHVRISSLAHIEQRPVRMRLNGGKKGKARSQCGSIKRVQAPLQGL